MHDEMHWAQSNRIAGLLFLRTPSRILGLTTSVNLDIDSKKTYTNLYGPVMAGLKVPRIQLCSASKFRQLLHRNSCSLIGVVFCTPNLFVVLGLIV